MLGLISPAYSQQGSEAKGLDSKIFDRSSQRAAKDIVNPKDTIRTAVKDPRVYTKCKCKDKVGTYNRSCYSTTDCATCCGFKLANPGDEGNVREGYEGPKKGVILQGKPEEKPIKTVNKDKSENKRNTVNLIFADGYIVRTLFIMLGLRKLFAEDLEFALVQVESKR